MFPIPMTTRRGLRRHRFAEASDFNAAANAVRNLLNRNLVAGRPIADVFFLFQMDEATPGSIVHIDHDSIQSEHHSARIMRADTYAAGVALCLDALLVREDAPYSLVSHYAVEYESAPNGIRTSRPVQIRLSLRSADSVASATYAVTTARNGVASIGPALVSISLRQTRLD